MKKTLFTLIISCVCCTLFAKEQEVQIDNTQVRVSRLKLAPGECIESMHQDYPSVICPLQGGTPTRVEKLNFISVPLTAGKALFKEKDPDQVVYNLSNWDRKPIEAIIIELKPQQQEAGVEKTQPKASPISSMLLETANRYFALTEAVGNDQKVCLEQEIEALFHPDCKKIINGITVVEGREYLAEKFIVCKEATGTWTSSLLDIIVSQEDRAVVMNYLTTTEKLGPFISTAICRYDENLLMKELSIVFNSYLDPQTLQ